VRVLMASVYGEDPSAGGVEKLLAELSTRLATRGVDVSFLQAAPAGGSVGDFDRTTLHRTDWRDDWTRRVKNHVGDVLARPAGTLERAVTLHRPDVVHTHNLTGISTGIWEVCRRLGLPVVHTLHDYYLLCPRVTLMRRDGEGPCRPSPLLCGLRTRRLTRWAPAVSHVIGVSQFLLDLHARLFPRARTHLIRHPLAASSRPRPRPPRATPGVLGYIGALDPIKGVHLLLQAAPRLEALGLSLRLAGEGRLRDEVARVAEQAANVEWEGSVLEERKRRFFEECDLGIVPSVWSEPGGPTFTMIEWLAASRPVLVSTRGGLGEVAGFYPGSIPVQPTVDSIVGALGGLREANRWSELVAAVRPSESDAEGVEWAEQHEAVYRSAIG
jgi:glycosyltransferase involved in cell wall biosynthesis